MKRIKTIFANWVCNLRDGALEVQRSFPFNNDDERAHFMEFLDRLPQSADLEVVANVSADSGSVIIVCIHFMPEYALLKPVRETVECCEREYLEIVSATGQSAA